MPRNLAVGDEQVVYDYITWREGSPLMWGGSRLTNRHYRMPTPASNTIRLPEYSDDQPVCPYCICKRGVHHARSARGVQDRSSHFCMRTNQPGTLDRYSRIGKMC